MKHNVFFAAVLLAGSAAAPAAVAQMNSPPIYAQPLTPSAVRQLQDHLAQAGDYAGKVDGVWGDDSRSALERFQRTHGLQVTGQLNRVTVTALGLAPSDLLATGEPAAPTTPSAAADAATSSSLSPAAIRAVQERLKDLNFYSGDTDGLWGAKTQESIKSFQQGRGLQPNGQLNPATISALGLNPNMFVTQTPQ